jgi:hypothetical protein
VFVRVKWVNGRRYLYLVEGRRDGAVVRQKTLCYLGPLSRLAFGIPEARRKRVSASLAVDWGRVADEIGRISPSFEELAEARKAQFVLAARLRGRNGRPSQGNLPRARGELSALTRLAQVRFDQMFETMAPLTYRMRLE